MQQLSRFMLWLFSRLNLFGHVVGRFKTHFRQLSTVHQSRYGLGYTSIFPDLSATNLFTSFWVGQLTGQTHVTFGTQGLVQNASEFFVVKHLGPLKLLQVGVALSPLGIDIKHHAKEMYLIINSGFHNPFGSLRITIHVENIPSTPCPIHMLETSKYASAEEPSNDHRVDIDPQSKLSLRLVVHDVQLSVQVAWLFWSVHYLHYSILQGDQF